MGSDSNHIVLSLRIQTAQAEPRRARTALRERRTARTARRPQGARAQDPNSALWSCVVALFGLALFGPCAVWVSAVRACAAWPCALRALRRSGPLGMTALAAIYVSAPSSNVAIV